MSLKFSNYNILHCPVAPFAAESEKVLLWNTVTGSFRAFEGKSGAAVRRAVSNGRPEMLTDELIRDFVDGGFLIPEEKDELSILEAELAAVSSGSSEYTGNYFRILTTTRCNAACPYCYEHGVPVQEMSMTTAGDTAAFIISRAYGGYAILEWFGGEPLLNTEPVTRICEELQAAGISYSSRITTNGSLWTDELVEKAGEIWKLQSVQITLDGIGDIHERTKGLPPGSFQKTIDSIRSLTQAGIRVLLRIVQYKGRDQEPLVEWIASEFCRDPLISACSAPGYAPGKEHSPVLMREVLALNKILIKAGFWGSTQSLLPHRRHIGCYSVSPKNYTITPEGYLCDCAHDLNSVHDSVRSRKNPEVRRAFLRETFSSECRICRLLPVCQGGCRVAELGSAPMTQCLPEKSIIAELMEMQDDYRREYEKRYG